MVVIDEAQRVPNIGLTAKLIHAAATDYMRDLANNYLYRDAFAANVVYDTTIINSLLLLLAYQVGNEVSYSELSNHLEISKETVKRYIDLLEKAFIIFRVNQYRKNQRSEVGRLRKIYFVGKLWENYCMVERQKYLQRNKIWARHYFWRSYTRQEVDLVEEIGTTTAAYEFKHKDQKVKIPTGFAKAYPEVSFKVITSTRFDDFLY